MLAPRGAPVSSLQTDGRRTQVYPQGSKQGICLHLIYSVWIQTPHPNSTGHLVPLETITTASLAAPPVPSSPAFHLRPDILKHC